MGTMGKTITTGIGLTNLTKKILYKNMPCFIPDKDRNIPDTSTKELSVDIDTTTNPISYSLTNTRTSSSCIFPDSYLIYDWGT